MSRPAASGTAAPRPAQPATLPPVAQSTPGEFAEYTVGGQPFSSVEPGYDPRIEKAATWLAQMRLRLGAYLYPNDPQVQTYRQAVLDRRQNPFTEQDYTPEHLASLARAVARSERAGRSSVQYEDYYPNGDYHTTTRPRELRPDGPFEKIIGRANYARNPNGGVTINDTYDFNNYHRTIPGAPVPEGPDAQADHAMSRFTNPLWLGRRALPSGVRGVPMAINLSPEMLTAARSSLGMLPPGGTP